MNPYHTTVYFILKLPLQRKQIAILHSKEQSSFFLFEIKALPGGPLSPVAMPGSLSCLWHMWSCLNPGVLHMRPSYHLPPASAQHYWGKTVPVIPHNCWLSEAISGGVFQQGCQESAGLVRGKQRDGWALIDRKHRMYAYLRHFALLLLSPGSMFVFYIRTLTFWGNTWGWVERLISVDESISGSCSWLSSIPHCSQVWEPLPHSLKLLICNLCLISTTVSWDWQPTWRCSCRIKCIWHFKDHSIRLIFKLLGLYIWFKWATP